MSSYWPSRSFDPDHDIRFRGTHVPSWARRLVEGHPPNDASWLVVMPRRSGKSWLASAIQRVRRGGSTRLVDVRSEASVRRAGLSCLTSSRAARPQLGGAGLVLIDEPAISPSSGATGEPGTLAAGLQRLRDEGVVPVVFATPAEHALLAPHLGADATKDVLSPPPLTDEEAACMASRTPEWALDVVARLRAEQPGWLLTPFLLELVLQVADSEPALRTDMAALSRRAFEAADFHPHLYIDQWFHNGLSQEHRSAIRRERWRRVGLSADFADLHDQTMRFLRPIADDPVLAHHLPEVLRVHHVSDLHFGGELRSNVDRKDPTQAGANVARLTGEGTPLDSYLEHVERIAELGRAPHLVIVSGDLVNRPEDSYGQLALDWLRRLESLLADHPDLRDGDPRVLLVGGNHDVSWDKCLDPRPVARHEWFAETFRNYPHPDLDKEDHEARRLYVRYADACLRIALLGSAESGGEPARDHDRERVLSLLAKLGSAGDAEISDLMGQLERHDPGVVAHPVLRGLNKEAGCVNLAVVHHPLSPVPAVEVAPYAGVVNAGQAKLALAEAHTSLVLHGHTHLGFLASERLIDREQPWTTRIAGAPALASVHSNEENGYNEIFIAREGGGHTLAVRTIRLRNGHWKEDLAIAFRPGAADECGFEDLYADPVRSQHG
ncbi:metallophosphoesterase [Streptomyces sp. MI02-2A]|uniref:metallophosphoesterase family protein n=1 Tax=unclassified Streptomyces TaxID=2593676 RepID=UPI000E25D1B7|nr:MULTISPECIES: metallophosphoesterase [unclassified Streptomyces]MDX3260176.1 metallophosphoesterase [Streptomyces sp. MI02-2A]REE64436.1 3',5'-cyclic AMP phosphodiesterase CpdA [Streptomyces sp. 3212.3]